MVLEIDVKVKMNSNKNINRIVNRKGLRNSGIYKNLSD